MKKNIVLILLMTILFIGGYRVGAAATVPASGVAYTNGSTSTTVKDSLDDLISKTKVGTATAAQILSGKTALVQGATVTGTMANKGAVTATINAGGSYTIPAGYHNGSGKVTANSLASQTSATATAAQILSGQTAYVNGTKLTGTMTNRGAVTSTLNAGGSYTIPAGYHSGSGKITANSLASQTSATATAADISSGKTAYVNGSKITGTNDGGYKVKEFSGTATVSYGKTFSGSWLAMGYEKASGCSGGECDWDCDSPSFSIDLGFTPTSVIAISATLSGSSYSTMYPFRMTRGYSAASTDATANYYYMGSLTTTKYYQGTYSRGGQTFDTGATETSSTFGFSTSVSGSKLYFNVSPTRHANTNGTTNNPIQTSATSFTLSGTIVYK